jgi:3-deoxy-D-manno-octulosonic-acid transferase
MYFFYNTLLVLVSLILSPFVLILIILRKKYRCGFMQKCGFYTEGKSFKKLKTRPIWIHAVSVGEVMATRPLVNSIKKTYPDIPIILSTVTETGNLTAHKNTKGVDQVIFFPLDYSFIVKKVISKINPLLFVTLETELWPNFSRELHLQNIPSLVISGRISSASFRSYSFFRFFFKKVLSNIDGFCMQTKTDADRIIHIGAPSEKVNVTGNIKFDLQIPPITKEEIIKIQNSFYFNDKDNIFIAGSTHRGEEEIIIKVFTALKKKINNLTLILAPRHPERFDEVEALIKQSKIPYLRRTALSKTPKSNQNHVILLDTIGELAKSYSIADIVFIGGSLVPVGGHNVLEPAVFRKPVIFGKHMDNFREMVSLLLNKKGAIQVNNVEEFIEQSLLLLNNKELCRQIGGTSFQVIKENSGAVNKSMVILKKILKNSVSNKLQ